ncbi:MAG: glycoside hydrolase family 2 protein [Epulopiscium sp.]|nr:glycoside hydrolase family 2 protein [Candidatus Epulonipiscium sp.]
MRMIQSMNNEWFYAPQFSEEYINQDRVDLNIFQPIRLPHTNIELPYNYFHDEDFQFISCYKRELEIPKEYEGKRIYLDFEGVMTYAKVYLNGQFVGEHKGGYTPFSIDLTEKAMYGQKNIITVIVDSTERPDIPPFGGFIDYLTFGGIYREVSLRVVEQVFIHDVFIKTYDVLSNKKRIEIDLMLTKNGHQEEPLIATCTLKQGDEVIQEVSKTIENNQVTISMTDLENIALWDIKNPCLYHMEVQLASQDQEIDRVVERFGFREAIFKADGFYLNGENIKLIGLNRHQAYPYVGYAMPKRAQQKDADILKNELGLNIVRTSHYPQSKHFLERCDEIGLLVFEEIPGWQHIGGKEWQDQAVKDVEKMIIRDRNHPSIIIWGVRINESGDHHELYTRTNELARKLDPTRQTGGVRYFEKSEFLEDVYTMNDFIHDGGLRKELARKTKNFSTYDATEDTQDDMIALRDQKQVTGLDYAVPYMVTEYNGHMYPTKKFDQEERVMEHVLRHVRVQDASFADDEISGAIGWCAFDYNTHADFGSGDKICYHGVMDMYRLPKFASYVYRSQKDPTEEIVLEPVTYWSRGDRSMGGVVPLVILTNCDYIEFYYGGASKGKYYPDKESFTGLPHPPVIIDELSGHWGSRWDDVSFVGYHNEKEVIRRTLSRSPVPVELEVIADDDLLFAKEKDVTRVVVKALDQHGNLMPFLTNPMVVKVEGAGELIGPNHLALIGGSIAFWVQTTGDKGNIQIQVASERFATQEITIKVE